ncbi:MAG: hypothetical protein NTY02_14170 [Acidobacteria bacterium]|nr:hypothetical protein [Acidobacteriota bacterium]
MFPSDNWWNLDISGAPVDPRSASFINFIGGTSRVHPDFAPSPYGIPFVTVHSTQPRVAIGSFRYPTESDAGVPGDAPGYPIPEEAKTVSGYIEGAIPGGGDSGDRHMLLIDLDRWLLYELYNARWNAGASRWEAGSGAIFDMSSNARRPEGWTSADAAGLAIFPGLVRYEEVYAGAPIRHAFRVTVTRTNGYVWPASHGAGSTAGAVPMGTRLRLKASVNLSGYSPALQRIFQAMKSYGLIVADNGGEMFVTGTMDSRWNNDELNPAFHGLHASDFEVIQLGWK